MDMIALKYSGKKPYRDRTALRTYWEPGNVKRVPAREAKTLLRFAEFGRATDEDTITEQPGEAEAAVAAQAQREQDQHNELEGMLMLVDSMDKDALEAYALKYETNLDKRRSLDKLRSDVVSLIEQFGVR
jgi:hypothetical protein